MRKDNGDGARLRTLRVGNHHKAPSLATFSYIKDCFEETSCEAANLNDVISIKQKPIYDSAPKDLRRV